jgi:hypothetical protein
MGDSALVSEAFVYKSNVFLRGEDVVLDSLADVQAIGVLALYEASFGQDLRAANLINEFAIAMADLYFNNVTLPTSISYNRIRSNSYRGAISLRRYTSSAGTPASEPLGPSYSLNVC